MYGLGDANIADLFDDITDHRRLSADRTALFNFCSFKQIIQQIVAKVVSCANVHAQLDSAITVLWFKIIDEQFHKQLKSCRIHVASSRDRPHCRPITDESVFLTLKHLHVLQMALFHRRHS